MNKERAPRGARPLYSVFAPRAERCACTGGPKKRSAALAVIGLVIMSHGEMLISSLGGASLDDSGFKVSSPGIEKAAARGLEELDLLFRIAEILNSSSDVPVVIDGVLAAMHERLGFRYPTVTLLSRNSSEIAIESAHGLSEKQRRSGRYRVGEGVTGKVVATGRPVIVPRVSQAPDFLNRTRRLMDEDFSFLCVPIMIGSEVVGTLSADRVFDPKIDLQADIRLLSIIAAMLAQPVKLGRSIREQHERLLEENERLQAELQHRFRPANIIGNSREMQVVYDQIGQVAKSPTTVLIQGETGTGKELVAHAIHYNSDRSRQPFVRVHCAALSKDLIESELFGHVKGSFTGATMDRKGRFEAANGGSIFLDEVAEIPPAIQIKLLRVLQEREFEKVGSTDPIKVNVRLIAATNQDLQAMVARGEFREDLFYRLHVFPIYVPPLRKRRADIALLADYFIEKYSQEYGKSVKRLSSAAIDMLYAYHWPGNVRELENVIERALVLAGGEVIHAHHLPPTLQTAEASGTVSKGDLKAMVARYERDIIVDALKSCRGNIAAAARLLRSTPRILGYKVRLYKISPKKYSE